MTAASSRTMLGAALCVQLAVAAVAGGQEVPRALTLGDAARLAVQHNGVAVAARFASEEMEAKARTSHAALLPSADAMWTDGQRSFNTASFGIPFPGFDPNGSVIGPVRTVDARARVGAPLWNPGRVGEYRTALASASRSEADAAVAAENVMANAATAYVRAVRAEARVSARAADSSLAAELLDIARGELEAGVGVALDVSRAQVQLAKVRAELSIARNERARARLDLLRATGLPLTTEIVLRDTLAMTTTAPAPIAVDAAVAQALEHRADLRAVSAAAQSTAVALRATQSERLPSVDVYADEGLTSAAYGHLKNTYSYGLQVSVPLFEGFRHESRLDERTAVLQVAEVRRHELETQIAAEVRGALLDMASAGEQAAASSDGLTFASQALSQARDRFTAGVAGSADAVSAQLDVSTARTLLIDALASMQLARVALAHAQGTLAELP